MHGNRVPSKCYCGSECSVAYWGCVVMRCEVKIQQKSRKEMISYAEAVKIVRDVEYKRDIRKIWIEKKENAYFHSRSDKCNI